MLLKMSVHGNDVGTTAGVGNFAGKGNCGGVLDIAILAFSVISCNNFSTVFPLNFKA